MNTERERQQSDERDGEAPAEPLRPEFEYIVDLVKPGSKVLDLGCGEGQLLKALQTRKRARVQGIEFSDTAIHQCVAKGLFVYHGDLDEGLADFNDQSVDYVILTNTIQVLHRPDFLINEAARVGKQCIISIPNFAFWRGRFQLMFGGMMPVTKRLPYEWYNTPNIHLTTIQDFRRFCREHGLAILKETALVLGQRRCKRVRLLPNFFADYAIFVIRRS
jgi:methionine biosynthesis protein MetW